MAGDSANSEFPIPHASPNKRLKLSSTGKAPIDYPNDETQSSPDAEYPEPLQRCGICLSEEGQAVRGYIDCCDHHFCFLCILEWSRIESRCPMCKRRFGIIRRMRKDGTFIGERAVTVPTRDQGDVTCPVDPYANVNCSVCHGNSNDYYLLLCDVCDSAMHTYCAGLGFIVPEGDWFCQECTIMKSEELNIENNSNRDIPSPSYSGSAPVSIFDIGRDSHKLDVVEIQDVAVGASSRKRKVPEASLGSKHRPTETSIRTLHACRNVHTRVRALRENWSAIRSGSLSFSSNFADSPEACNSEVTVAVRGNSSGESSGRNTAAVKDQHDVAKAWKMLDIAKSMQPPKRMIGIVSSTSVAQSRSSCALKAKKVLPVNLQASGSATSRTKDSFCGIRAGTANRLLLASNGKCPYYSSKNADTSVSADNSGVHLGTSNRLLPASSNGKFPYYSSKNANMSVPADNSGVHLGTASRLHSASSPAKCAHFTSQNSDNTVPVNSCGANIGSTASRFQPASSSGTCTTSTTKSTRVESHQGYDRAEKVQKQSQCVRDSDAKSEIASLVKLNMKLFSVDKKYGTDVFKDIARRSTHEILAACGLETWENREHSAAGHTLPTSVCCHYDQMKKEERKCSLMSNCCRECFYAFVKEVVNSMLSNR